jgi:hypothetical protein
VPLSRSWSISKSGNSGGGWIAVSGVGAGTFSKDRLQNFVYDVRYPIITPQGSGPCRNIYAANVVSNGATCFAVYFGGWDGVDSCHDSISVTVTDDSFGSFNPHYPMISTGTDMHVNNPSTVNHYANEQWYMVYTQLPYNEPPRNKPGYAQGPNGIAWDPNSGGVNFLTVAAYPDWSNADVNGGNVLFIDNATSTFHLFFVDFQNPSGSVYHASAVSTWAMPSTFEYTGIAVSEPCRVVNDVKLVGGTYVMLMHCNTFEVYVSFSTDLFSFSTTVPLFQNFGPGDQYIVSASFVVPDSSDRILGVLYGAGPTSALDNNNVYAVWLQRRVLFKSSDNTTVWGLGQAARAVGPHVVQLKSGASELVGRFWVYDSDYNPMFDTVGTLLWVSQEVTVVSGDSWVLSE